MAQLIKVNANLLNEGLQVEIGNGTHKVMVDEPVEAGGTDKGMNPGEYLLVALAGCQALGFKSFAKAKGLSYDSLEIEVEGDVDVSGLMKGDPTAYTGYQEIRSTYHVKSSASEEEIKEIIGMAEHFCPIGQSLTKNQVKLAEPKIICE